MPKVVFFTNLAAETAALLTQHAPPDYEVVTAATALPDDEKAALVQDADFLILFPGVISERVLRAARRLKLIQLVSAGFDQLDLALCRELGIPVANNGGANAIDVAEHTVALILAWYRRMGEMDANVRSGRWNAIDSGIHTHTIWGKRVGIVGLGNIGRCVALLLRAFGAGMVYTDAVPAPQEVERSLGVARVSLDELLEMSDIVTLHVPLNAQTRGLISHRELARMKPSALLVNTCRGPVVEEAALIDALRRGQIAGAALDVLAQEPPAPNNPLFQMKNVLLTPHIAGVTRDTWGRRGVFIFHNLQRVRQGEPPLAVVQ
ncbi:MAG TPA: 2-hydroxyacid dehydrogenase [Caldilineaceae bacterium]|nr:2-hydroxyacid dehydrogenase [Caldilineaceae bacterium]